MVWLGGFLIGMGLCLFVFVFVFVFVLEVEGAWEKKKKGWKAQENGITPS